MKHHCHVELTQKYGLATHTLFLFKNYSKKLMVGTSLLQQLGELFAKPNFDIETLLLRKVSG